MGEGNSMGTSPVEFYNSGLAGIGREVEILTASECKAAGGRWLGGHDVSGHVFLLCLSSAVLAFEVLPVLNMKSFQNTPSSTLAEASEISDGTAGATASPATRLATRFALAVAGLSWWMLLMTAIFFHTWFEKLTGLVIALVAIWSLYVLPRAVRKSVIGTSRG